MGTLDFVKKQWSKGRELITISALLNTILVLVPLLVGSISQIRLYG